MVDFFFSLAKANVLAVLIASIRNPKSEKTRKLRFAVEEIKEACEQFLAVVPQ